MPERSPSRPLSRPVASAMAILVGAAVLYAHREEPFLAFVAQEPLQNAWLLVRLVAVGGTLFAIEGAKRAGLRALGIVACTILTFVVRGALAPWLALVTFVLARSGVGIARLPPGVAAPTFVALVIGAVALSSRPPTVGPAPPRDAPLATAYWSGRGNLQRARHAARAWARFEGQNPGPGHLALADAEFALGRPDVARAVLERALDRALDADVRERAKQKLAAFPAEPR